MSKCYRIGCDKEATQKYKDKKSLCWLDPVCDDHQFVEPKEKITTVAEFFEKGGQMCDCEEDHDGECPEEVCEHCGGTGEVSVMEQLYPHEPHMADVGSQTCICKLRDPDDYDDQE